LRLSAELPRRADWLTLAGPAVNESDLAISRSAQARIEALYDEIVIVDQQ
jgi:hypothetical protein